LGFARFAKPTRLVSLWCGSAREPSPMKTDQAGFAGYSMSDFFSNWFWVYFRCGKLRDCMLDMFSTGTTPSLIYKREDHGWLRNPTSNLQKAHLLLFCPSSFYLCCSSHLSMRFGGILSGLADPRSTSLCSSSTGLLGRWSGVSNKWRTGI
jgi:hypothetical protein